MELLNEEVAEATVSKDIQIVKELEVDLEATKEANAKLHRELAELGEKIGGATVQVWSISCFKVSRQPLRQDLNQISSVSLLMTASTAPPTKGFLS